MFFYVYFYRVSPTSFRKFYTIIFPNKNDVL